MRITKIFDIILNIDNINIIFSNNIEDQIFNLIEQKYLNKCYLESYIIKINKILNRSLLESNQNNLNCDFIVYIQFEAECIIYSQNEVILNMEIHENINNNIIAKNNYIVTPITLMIRLNRVISINGGASFMEISKAFYKPEFIFGVSFNLKSKYKS